MEANPSAFKASVSLAVGGTLKFKEESPPKRKTSFMVDDIVRDPNNVNSLYINSASYHESSFPDWMQPQTPSTGGKSEGINGSNIYLDQHRYMIISSFKLYIVSSTSQ